jgi:hypothetical protein
MYGIGGYFKKYVAYMLKHESGEEIRVLYRYRFMNVRGH